MAFFLLNFVSLYALHTLNYFSDNNNNFFSNVYIYVVDHNGSRILIVDIDNINNHITFKIVIVEVANIVTNVNKLWYYNTTDTRIPVNGGGIFLSNRRSKYFTARRLG